MTAERRLWTKEEIQNFLDKEDPHYQKIQLPFGLATRGRDRKQTSNLIFTQIAGKTVLDVGCCLGYFCLEALAHGALRAVGWDLNADRVRQGRVIAEILGSSAEYHQCNIEEIVPRETFDTVICLNVLHHVRNPLQTLEKLVQLTRETLVLELASLGTPDRRKAGLSRWQGWVLRRLPIILVAGRRAGQNFFSRVLESETCSRFSGRILLESTCWSLSLKIASSLSPSAVG